MTNNHANAPPNSKRSGRGVLRGGGGAAVGARADFRLKARILLNCVPDNGQKNSGCNTNSQMFMFGFEKECGII